MELFLSGEYCLDLAELIHYKNNGSSDRLEQKLSKIEIPQIRNLAKHMLKLDPAQRRTSASYLLRLMSPDPLNPDPVIPESFSTFMNPMTTAFRFDRISADSKIELIASKYEEAVRLLAGENDVDGALFFQRILVSRVCFLMSRPSHAP